MSDKKICPLTYSIGKGAYDQENADFDYCVEEKCAWWIGKTHPLDTAREGCAILLMTKGSR